MGARDTVMDGIVREMGARDAVMDGRVREMDPNDTEMCAIGHGVLV